MKQSLSHLTVLLSSHLLVRAVFPHCQVEEGCQGVEQLQPLFQAPGSTVISPARRLPPTKSIHHPVTQLHTTQHYVDHSLTFGPPFHNKLHSGYFSNYSYLATLFKKKPMKFVSNFGLFWERGF